MKLRVVDWVDYDDDDYPEGKIGWAARNAVIDEIRAHGYNFSGWAHQEGYRCAPVLNDGCRYLWSQRGWGDVMAEAHGGQGAMDYVSFAFGFDSSNETRPDPDSYYNGEPETDLNETFEREVFPVLFEKALREHEISLDSFEDLRYLDEGDKLILTCGDRRATYVVSGIRRVRTNADGEADSFALNVTLAPLA